MIERNKRMMAFLKSHGIKASVKYLDKGSLSGCWRLYDRNTKWSMELADKLNSLGFKDFGGRPLGRFSGNAGLLCVCVWGHNEFLTDPEEISDAYANADAVSTEARERNDCAVRAVAMASGRDYDEVLKLFSEHGRKRRCRTKTHVTNKVVAALGLKLVPARERFSAKTVAKLAAELPASGTFLVRVPGHVLCARDGAIHDWTAGRGHHIREILEVVAETLTPADGPAGVVV